MHSIITIATQFVVKHDDAFQLHSKLDAILPTDALTVDPVLTPPGFLHHG